MLFAVDIGNTNIHVGVLDGMRLQARFSLGVVAGRTADEYALLFSTLAAAKGVTLSAVDAAIVGSVAPSVTPAVRAALKALLDVPVTVVGPGVKTGFPIRLDAPAELGADLVANAAGAIARFGAPLLVADFGTATTVIAIDNTGALQGGAILPGVEMSLQALGNAELLPGVSATGEVAALGKNTRDAMRAGVIRGTAMAVTGLAEQYRRTLSLAKSTPLILCGGHAETLLPYLPDNVQYCADLTLVGLAAIYEKNQK